MLERTNIEELGDNKYRIHTVDERGVSHSLQVEFSWNPYFNEWMIRWQGVMGVVVRAELEGFLCILNKLNSRGKP